MVQRWLLWNNVQLYSVRAWTRANKMLKVLVFPMMMTENEGWAPAGQLKGIVGGVYSAHKEYVREF
jgi:hypothetical protein